MSEPADPRTLTGQFELRLGEACAEVEVTVPSGPSRVADVLPAIRALTDAVVDVAVERLTQSGERISCRAGCGACCRQPVPIAGSEAVAIGELVERMAEPRRRAVTSRFAAALARLEEHGLLEVLSDLAAIDGVDERQALALRYFALGIACPFLEDESCSIHFERPLACREYLVTSPAMACGEPSAESVALMPLPARPSVTLFGFDGSEVGVPPRSLLLVRALAHRAEPEAPGATGVEVFERFARKLASEDP